VKVRRVFFYVQHLLGIGHLKRAATLANALAAAGMQVTFASGGFPVPGIRLEGVRLVQLPPASSDTSFKVLVDVNGRPVDEPWKARRRALLMEAWSDFDPHAVVVELYPFGRRQMRFELLPLLDAVTASARRPLLACSVRDILGGGQTNPARQDEMLSVFERYFDRLLVHSDPAVIPFDRTFIHAGRIESKLHYTGYVVEDAPAKPARTPAGSPAGRGEVLVSAGGGAVGMRLLEVAIQARPLTGLAERTWRVLGGVNAPADRFSALIALAQAKGQGRIIVERAREDFTTLIANCAVSVSQGGYNTMMELLQAGTRAVVVPFAGGSETEQSLRARLFRERGLIELVEEAELGPQTLAAAIDKAANKAAPAARSVDLGGAPRTAALLEGWLAELEW
jgi:predicted glycosyltransferase